MIDFIELISAAISLNICVNVFIMICIMTITHCMIEGIMTFTIEMIFHHIGHVIDMIKSVRNAPSSSPLKFRTWSWSRGKLVWKWNQPRPVGTRIDAYGVRILFGGKSKSTKSPGAQKFPSPVGGTVSLAQSVLGWANWCCEVLCSITVVAYMKSYYSHPPPPTSLSPLVTRLPTLYALKKLYPLTL